MKKLYKTTLGPGGGEGGGGYGTSHLDGLKLEIFYRKWGFQLGITAATASFDYSSFLGQVEEDYLVVEGQVFVREDFVPGIKKQASPEITPEVGTCTCLQYKVYIGCLTFSRCCLKK